MFVCGNFHNLQAKYIQRLKAIRATLSQSDFFLTHEVIGSSLLFVHDKNQASIWLIDFAKTVSLPKDVHLTHMNEWIVGNHEDGYLIGINNLIQIFQELLTNEQSQSECQSTDSNTDANTKCIEAKHIDQSNAFNEQRLETFETSVQQSRSFDLPQEIDAMKIDQTTQHQTRETSDEHRNQDKRDRS